MEEKNITAQAEGLSKYELKKQKKETERKQREHGKQTKNIAYIIMGLLVVVGVVAGIWWLVANQEPIEEGDIISRTSIHWHPQLDIRIHGERQEIPANIGITGLGHSSSVHTHDSSGTLHYETSAPVLRDHLMIVQLFDSWKRQFNSQCIFEFCNGDQGTVSMFVNGEPNDEFEMYAIQDGDKIEIIFE